MEADPTKNNSSLQKKWIVILCVSSLLLAIFWSVDSSLFYMLLAGVLFSFFKVLQFKQHEMPVEPDEVEEPNQPSRAEAQWKMPDSTPTASSLLQRKKVLITLVLGFFGFILFFVIVGSLVDFVSSTVGDFEYQQKASSYYYNQQYDSSAYYYRLAIESDPENADLWFERGNAFLNYQQSDSAILMYRKAVELRPEFEQAQYNIGYVYFEQKNYREAADETKKLLKVNPEYTDAKLLLGDSFYNQSQLDSALQRYESAYKTGYRSAILCHLMAYIHDTKGRTQVAIDLYKEAIRQDTTITDIYVRLGELVSGEEGEKFREKAAYMSAQSNQ
jgi:tetratricopeptide (TPR) repeat protein